MSKNHFTFFRLFKNKEIRDELPMTQAVIG